MKKTALALVTAAALGAASLAAPAPAEAASTRDIIRGLAIGGAVLGGAALLYGAAAHAHLAHPSYYPYAPVSGYYYFPQAHYAAPAPVACPNGFWAYKVNRHGQPYGKPRWVCSPGGYYASHYVYR
ncbi:MAG TPA: hypothetical protein VFY21_07900 [Xanthobacteraceae bacterium]|nr:hypothetical protein [Xanthobacteraceae bacterium]